MKTSLLLVLLFTLGQAFSQSPFWEYHNVNVSGFNNVYDFTSDGQDKLFMNTDFGFCVYNLRTNQYDSCYNANPSFRNNTKPVLYGNNTAWIITPNGVSSYNSGVITNYTMANGLPSITIEDAAIDRNGTLWVASRSGVARFNGTSFVVDTVMSARHIAVDSLNRVYAFEGTFIGVGGPSNASTMHIKDQNGWTSFTVTGIDSIQKGGPVILGMNMFASEGQLLITSSRGNGIFYRMGYPAAIEEVQLRNTSGQLFSSNIQRVARDTNNRYWTVSNVGLSGLYSSDDSLLFQHHFGVFRQANSAGFNQNVEQVKVFGDKVIASTDNGLFSADISIEPIRSFSEEIDVNSIRTSASVIGPLFNRNESFTADFEFPKGNNSYGIYAGSPMLVSKKQNSTDFKVNQLNVFQNNFAIGPVSNGAALSGTWIVKVSQQDIASHQANYRNPNYVVPENIASWMGNGDTSIGVAPQLAPFEDLNSNGFYEPMNGEYPIIKGDEAIYWINHIDDIEYHGMLYGFDRPGDSALNQSLFLSYQLFNRSNTSIDSAKFGLFMDFDLGNPVDDYVGCDSLKNTFFVYNGDPFDENFSGTTGFGSNPPFLGVKMLSDSMDGFFYYVSGNGLNGDPAIDDHWKSYLNGEWQNGQPMRFGGDGLNNTYGGATKHLYTGTPWAEESPGPGLNPIFPGDRRGVGHIPWFSLGPNQSKTIEMVIGYAQVPNSGHFGSKNLLISYLDSAASYWGGNIITGFQEQNNAIEASFRMYPNPTNEQLVIETSNSKIELNQQALQIVALDGKIVKEIKLNRSRTVLDVSNLETGIYLVKHNNQVQKLVKQ